MNAQGSRTRGEEQGTGVRDQGTGFGRERTGQANPQSAIRNPQSARFPLSAFRLRPGFTLIEVLVAMALTLLMMGMVVTIFGYVSGAVTTSRSTMEMGDQMRSTRQRLQSDLGGVTVKMLPPRRTIYDEGYFEAIEGPAGRTLAVTKLVDEPYDDANKNGKWDTGETFADLSGDGNWNQHNDSTVGDNDDILMFTTRSPDEPFVGRFGNDTEESPVAEVAWFLRGTTLYRRVLLVKPSVSAIEPTPAFYGSYDLSVHQEGNDPSPPSGEPRYDPRPNPGDTRLVPNTLGDLSRREYRYAHQPVKWPYDARFWGHLRLPTLVECSHGVLPFPCYDETVAVAPPPPGPQPMKKHRVPSSGTNTPAIYPLQKTSWENLLDLRDANEPFDAWTNPFPWKQTDPVTGTLLLDDGVTVAAGSRPAEDVVMTNVLSFDVKVWDPTAPVISVNADGNPVAADDASVAHVLVPGDAGYLEPFNNSGTDTFAQKVQNLRNWIISNPNAFARGAYVDLNYLNEDPPSTTFTPTSVFSHRGVGESKLQGSATDAAVYDTGSFHYEHDGINQDGDTQVDEGTNGFDDDGNGIVDDVNELEMPPPYTAPLRGIQIKIRAFEPDSRAIREMTIVQEFLPE